MRNSKLVFLGLGMVAMSACGGGNGAETKSQNQQTYPVLIGQDQNPNPGVSPLPTQAPEVGETLPDHPLIAKLVAGAAANHYEVSLSWTYYSNFVGTFSITRSDGVTSMVQLTTDGSDVRTKVDLGVAANKSYTYQLKTFSRDGSESVVGTAQIAIPVDLQISGHQKLGDLTYLSQNSGDGLHTIAGYNRIFFDDGAVLEVGNEDFELDANELHCGARTGCVIENLETASTAALGVAGAKGSNLTLNLGSASGLITLISRGENGGQGLQGAKGSAGATGSYGSYSGCFTDRGIPQGPINLTSGGPGGKGGKGENGQTGMTGGDSGKISFYLKHPSDDFHLTTSLIPGSGGAGGLGGSGGDGGAGGPGVRTPCWGESSGSGPQGPVGDTGAPGPVGAPGRQTQVCLNEGNFSNTCN